MALKDVMQSYVDRGEVPGVITGTVRGDDVEIGVHGWRTLGTIDMAGHEMRRDTIIRIASMSRPIAAAAAMALVEDGILDLDGPIEDFIPEFVYQQVLRDPTGPLDDTVPADRPITLRDVLTYRSGFGFDPAVPFDAPIMREALRLSVGIAPPKTQEPLDLDEWLARLATLPLMSQPGTRWAYQTPGTVLGALLSRAAGQDVEVVLREQILDPLGMSDTSFAVPPEKLDRLATAYRYEDDHPVVADPSGPSSLWAAPPPFPDAGGDLVSTVDDYLTFARMLRDGGSGILSPESVALMTTQHLTPDQQAFEPDEGWGFGMSVTRSGPHAGRYTWNGGLGTLWFNDPRADLIAILLTQRALDSPAARPIDTDFTTQVYAR